jgi:hypothetical protein
MSNTGGGEKSCDKNRAGQDLQTTNGKTKLAGRVEKSVCGLKRVHQEQAQYNRELKQTIFTFKSNKNFTTTEVTVLTP